MSPHVSWTLKFHYSTTLHRFGKCSQFLLQTLHPSHSKSATCHCSEVGAGFDWKVFLSFPSQSIQDCACFLRLTSKLYDSPATLYNNARFWDSDNSTRLSFPTAKISSWLLVDIRLFCSLQTFFFCTVQWRRCWNLSQRECQWKCKIMVSLIKRWI